MFMKFLVQLKSLEIFATENHCAEPILNPFSAFQPTVVRPLAPFGLHSPVTTLPALSRRPAALPCTRVPYRRGCPRRQDLRRTWNSLRVVLLPSFSSLLHRSAPSPSSRPTGHCRAHHPSA